MKIKKLLTWIRELFADITCGLCDARLGGCDPVSHPQCKWGAEQLKQKLAKKENKNGNNL